MINFQPKKIKISRSHIIVPAVLLLLLSFIISAITIQRISDDLVDSINCKKGTHLYYPESNEEFYYYTIEVIRRIGTCPDSTIGSSKYPTIIIFDKDNETLYESNSDSMSGSIIRTHSDYIRIEIDHESITIGYGIIISIRHFKISKPILFSFLGCVSIFFTSMVFTFIYIEKKPRGRLHEEIDETSTTIEILENIGDKDKVLREIKFLESKLTVIDYDQIPEKAVCMISKTTFEKDNEIAQCSNCFSCYLKEYILNWLEKDKHCPVCQAELE